MDTDPFFSTNLLKMDVLDTVLGDYFTGLPIVEFSKKVVNLTKTPYVSISHGNKFPELLHESTLRFVSYSYTRADANFAELPRLLEKIEVSADYLLQADVFATPQYFYALYFVYYLSRVLFLVISNFSEKTTSALDQISVHSRLASLLRIISQLCDVAPLSPYEDNVHKLVHLEILSEAREWIFFFVQIYLETPRNHGGLKSRRSFARSEGYYRALSCSSLIETFFSLLEHSDMRVRTFGLLHIAKMMKVDTNYKKYEKYEVPSDFDSRDGDYEPVSLNRQRGLLLTLYGKFLDFVVQLQYSSVKSKSEANSKSKRELMIFLLDVGIPEVVSNEGKKRAERQNLFREMNCFVKLLSLLHDEPTNELERRELGELSVTILRALTRLIMGNEV
jgi:hypothetical protein